MLLTDQFSNKDTIILLIDQWTIVIKLCNWPFMDQLTNKNIIIKGIKGI